MSLRVPPKPFVGMGASSAFPLELSEGPKRLRVGLKLAGPPGSLRSEGCADCKYQPVIAKFRNLGFPASGDPVVMIDRGRLKDHLMIFRLPHDFIGKHKRLIMPADIRDTARPLAGNNTHKQTLQLDGFCADRDKAQAVVEQLAEKVISPTRAERGSAN